MVPLHLTSCHQPSVPYETPRESKWITCIGLYLSTIALASLWPQHKSRVDWLTLGLNGDIIDTSYYLLPSTPKAWKGQLLQSSCMETSTPPQHNGQVDWESHHNKTTILGNETQTNPFEPVQCQGLMTTLIRDPSAPALGTLRTLLRPWGDQDRDRQLTTGACYM